MKKIYFVILTAMLLVSCSEKSNKLTFRNYIYERFDADSIVQQLGELSRKTCENGAPIYYVGYDLEFPVTAVNDEVLRRLQLNVISIVRQDVNLMSTDSQAEINRLFADMRLTEHDSCSVDPIQVSEGEMNITSRDFSAIRTITNTDSLYTLCLSTDCYAFGAAHGFYSLCYYSFNPATGNMLTFDSLFVEGAATKFCDYMTRQIPIEYEESYSEKFSFQSDPDVENGSFYFTVDGVMFSFSPYAIGSFADGQIDCLIPVSIAKPLLRKEWSTLLK